MKKSVVGLIGLALLYGAPLRGQERMPAPGSAATGALPAPVRAAAAEDVSVVIVGPDAPCPQTRTICVREEYIKKTEKPVYSCGSEPLCLPYHCSLFSLFGHKDCDSCGPPYTRRYLIKKIKTTEKCDTKCVAVEVPACGQHGSCPAPISPPAGSPAPSAPEPIPAPAPGKPELIPAPGSAKGK